MYRRAVLASGGTVLTTVLAGCGGDGDGGEATPDSDTPTPTEAETATPTEAETPTPTEAETPADTPTPEGSGTTHEVGETFTVGEAGNDVTYRIIEFKRADQIGSQVNFDEADGTYLIIIMEITNPRDETIQFPERNFRLRTEEAWQRFEREPSQKLESDDRVDVPYIGDDSFPAGASQIGAVAFDVDPSQSYRIWITPTGEATTPEHFVPIGDISSIEALGGY